MEIPFLNRCKEFCSDLFSKKRDSRAKNSLTKHILATRYVTESNWSKSRRQAKPGAFMPRLNPAAHRLELSVAGIDGLSDGEIWELANTYLVPHLGRQPKGRADFPVEKLKETVLKLVDDDAWERRHSNMLGWPEPEEDQLELAGLLLGASKSVECPRSTR